MLFIFFNIHFIINLMDSVRDEEISITSDQLLKIRSLFEYQKYIVFYCHKTSHLKMFKSMNKLNNLF